MIPSCRANYCIIIWPISNIYRLLLFNMCSTVDEIWSKSEGVLISVFCYSIENVFYMSSNSSIKKIKSYLVNNSLYRELAREYDVAVQEFFASKELKVASSRNFSCFFTNFKLANIYGIPSLTRSDGTIATSDLELPIKMNILFLYLYSSPHRSQTVQRTH